MDIFYTFFQNELNNEYYLLLFIALQHKNDRDHSISSIYEQAIIIGLGFLQVLFFFMSIMAYFEVACWEHFQSPLPL